MYPAFISYKQKNIIAQNDQEYKNMSLKIPIYAYD